MLRLVKEKYKTEPEYLWRRFPRYAVLRHEDWYAHHGCAEREFGTLRNGASGRPQCEAGRHFICRYAHPPRRLFQRLPHQPGEWVSVLLNGTVPMNEIQSLLDESYAVTAKKYRKQRSVRRRSGLSRQIPNTTTSPMPLTIKTRLTGNRDGALSWAIQCFSTLQLPCRLSSTSAK